MLLVRTPTTQAVLLEQPDLLCAIPERIGALFLLYDSHKNDPMAGNPFASVFAKILEVGTRKIVSRRPAWFACGWCAFSRVCCSRAGWSSDNASSMPAATGSASGRHPLPPAVSSIADAYRFSGVFAYPRGCVAGTGAFAQHPQQRAVLAHGLRTPLFNSTYHLYPQRRKPALAYSAHHPTCPSFAWRHPCVYVPSARTGRALRGCGCEPTWPLTQPTRLWYTRVPCTPLRGFAGAVAENRSPSD